MFGLPRSLVESPKLGKLKQMIHNKKINKQNNLSYEEMGPAGKYLHFNLKSSPEQNAYSINSSEF